MDLITCSIRRAAVIVAFSLLFSYSSQEYKVIMAEGSEVEQATALAEGVARSALTLFSKTGPGKEKWSYERGVLLIGLQRLWQSQPQGARGDEYLHFIQTKTDQFVQDNGTILTYKLKDYELDNILPGRNVLFLWKKTGLEKYARAATLLRSQLDTHNRTREGGFWHKAIYPYQMWLDGLYMAQPFYAEYALSFNEPADFDDIAKQFVLTEKHLRDSKTGLFYHGYDESRAQNWSDPVTGDSPSFWGRADGWLAMALVDTLDYFPQKHPDRATLIAIFQRLASAVINFQVMRQCLSKFSIQECFTSVKSMDSRSAVWWEVLDRGGDPGNYLESSASAMFVYAFAKGVRLGYLEGQRYHDAVGRGYEGLVKQFITSGSSKGALNLTRTVSVGGLGGDPYRNGTYEYYLSEAVQTNDAKGIGPFLMASAEIASR